MSAAVSPRPPEELLRSAEIYPADAPSKLELVLRNGGLVLIDWNVATGSIVPSSRLAQLLDLDEHAVPTTIADLEKFEHPRDKARVTAELRAHLDGESDDHHCEYRLKSAKGRIRWVIASGRVVERSRDGEPLYYLGTLQDVTETLETSHELQRQLARSQEAMRVSEDLTREVRQLEAEIREISQREHERIGHDLHDGLGQELTGVSLLLKILEDAIERDAPQLRSRVHSVRDMVEQSIASTRALAQGLVARASRSRRRRRRARAAGCQLRDALRNSSALRRTAQRRFAARARGRHGSVSNRTRSGSQCCTPLRRKRRF